MAIVVASDQLVAMREACVLNGGREMGTGALGRSRKSSNFLVRMCPTARKGG